MGHNHTPPSALSTTWRERAQFLQDYGDPNTARLWQLAAAELDEVLQALGAETLTLAQAAALQNLANVVMAFIDKDMTFEYTHGGPVESPESEHIAGEVQILVDGEVLGGWVNPRTAHDWLLGVVWGVQHRAAG